MPINLPVSQDAEISIVILAWRRVDLLRTCLESLAGLSAAPPFEVQIVANGATPEVLDFLQTQVEGAQLTVLRENVGFGVACNIGAAASKAKYLVFLNDDVIVMPDWLTELHATAQTPGAVAAASLLLNVDGTVQEAGSRVCRGGITLPLGAQLTIAEASAQGYLTVRPLDYGSAAALIVGRNDFLDVGGFDKRYCPAYFEDVDLCLRLRAKGGDVLLAPSSCLVHLMHGNSLDMPWFRQFAMEHARAAFEARWAATIATAPEADAPLGALCDVSGYSAAPEAGELAMGDDLAVALGIQRDYAAWLSQQLTAAQGQLDEQAATSSQLTNYLAQLGSGVAEVSSSVQQLHQLAFQIVGTVSRT